jgi:hypothetical protein
MNMDDFLWESAFMKGEKDRQWIIPDKEELSLVSEMKIYSEYDIYARKSADILMDANCTTVKVLEKRENGIMDIIGGEVWEASLLLSSFIVLNQQSMVSSEVNILELGCGVGLPSFLLANLYLELLSTSLANCPTYMLTDYESSLLNNLQTIVNRSYLFIDTATDSFTSASPKLKLCISSLDWNQCGEKENQFENSNPLLHPDHYSYLIGSALCYAPFHAHCLLNVVK